MPPVDKMIKIRKPKMEDAVEYNACVDGVAREGRYILTHKGPPIEKTKKFLASNIERKLPQFFAFIEDEFVGWCDIIPGSREVLEHRGELGIGIAKEYRGQGVGALLLKETISAAKDFGLEKVELTVYTSNVNAISFYKKFGFEEEGRISKYRKVNGKYNDAILMAMFL